MRSQDRRIFAEAAAKFEAWILVRRTNPASLEYIGRRGYTPKPIDCKPKTADLDVGDKQLAGLVADPTLHARAFRPDKLSKALSIWRSFARRHGWGSDSLKLDSSEYAVDRDPRSKHFGCLMFRGKYVHGDYDLYDIILTKHPRGNLAALETLRGVPHRRGPRVIPIMKFINDRIGAPMIQHGGAMQFEDHSEQSVDAFGPHGEQCTILNEYSIRAWYRQTFQGRRSLGPA